MSFRVVWTQASRLPWAWGAPVVIEAPDELECAGLPQMRLATRSVYTSAEPEALFLWLCQLRHAPYSYDWIDNFGRRSPRQADPGMQDLRVGQRFMTIFILTGYEPGKSLTLRMSPGWPTRAFGTITVKYQISQAAESWSQLSVALWMPPIGRRMGRFRRYLLAWGDVVMMRKQLRVLSELAEQEARGVDQRQHQSERNG
ncbi:hypothetical protein [Nesterenkonia muleiensis]|uniref:hypothetical protein n=1 Tax=Nesterenkonia muleiensis TaxID=2282648 RepID=UPI000E73F2CB|nr:hypothetical protein [Nesterenkonia muleiensis]